MTLYRPEWRFKGNHEKPVRKADMLVEIRNEHFQNISVTAWVNLVGYD
jgi:hypothetical protein